MNWHTQRVKDGNLRYHQEHTKPDAASAGTLLPKSNMFADTTATLGVASRGFHFTGRSTASDNHDEAIHSDASLLYDNRQNNESFIDSRNGSLANPSFKTPIGGVQTTGPNPDGTAFAPSTAEPPAQGSGGAGPSWWHRITGQAQSKTQSTNTGTKPPEKYQMGLRSSNVKIRRQDQKNSVGPLGVAGPSLGTST